jgi:hypothetical protein
MVSVGDPDPQDLHVFGPPGSGSISQRYGSGSIAFLIKVLSGLKNTCRIKFYTNLANLLIFKTEDNVGKL